MDGGCELGLCFGGSGEGSGAGSGDRQSRTWGKILVLILCEGIILGVLLGSAAVSNDETADSVKKIPFLFYVKEADIPGGSASYSSKLAYRYGTLGSCVTTPAADGTYGSGDRTECAKLGEYVGYQEAGKPFEAFAAKYALVASGVLAVVVSFIAIQICFTILKLKADIRQDKLLSKSKLKKNDQADIAEKHKLAEKKYERREARVRSWWFSLPQMVIVPALGAIIALASFAPVYGAGGNVGGSDPLSDSDASVGYGVAKRQEVTLASPARADRQLEAKVHWGALLLIVPIFAYTIIVLIDLFHHRRWFRGEKKDAKDQTAPTLPRRPSQQ